MFGKEEEEVHLELIVTLIAKQREEKENPFAINRREPFNELKNLQDWSNEQLFNVAHIDKMHSINQLKSRLNDYAVTDERIQSILLKEFKYSNFIEGIHNDNERLLSAWDFLANKKLTKKNMLAAVSELSPDGGYIRKKAVCLASNNGIHHTPPNGNRRLHAKIDKLVSFKSDEISNWVLPILFHIQYELIHPLSDGNGRSGRLFLVKQLMEDNELSFPILLSESLYHSKRKYYRELNSPMFLRQWDTSVSYFLNCIDEALIETLKLIDDIPE